MLLRQRANNITALLQGRQLQGGPVTRRPFVAEFCCDGGTVMNNPGLTGTPAFAAEYSRVYGGCKLLAIADEEGYVSIVDTACQLPTEMADDYSPNKPSAQWMAHRNAVFDLSWCNGDSQMLTASGDQTVALWDTGHADQIASFRGHSGSVKTVCPMPASHAVFASGARDGALMVWDARVAARQDGNGGEAFHAPVITVQDAHAPSGKQKRRRTPLQGRTRPSVTSLTFLQGAENMLATGGVDGVVKFWDLRQAAAGPAAQAAPGLQLERVCDAGVPPISQKQHGITSLALSPQGSQLLVSLTGGHHFIYDPLRPQIGPTRWFGGHTVASFYVKAAWSPDGTHIISGSTDRSVYIWEVDAPDGASPYVLPGHQGEVTAVAWCPADFHQISTTADDATLKVWNITRRQPEEQADDRAPAQPWVYPWQQQQQVAAAAAAAAAYHGVGQAPDPSATPLSHMASGATGATSAGTPMPRGATPTPAGGGNGRGGEAALRAPGSTARGPVGASTAGAEQQGGLAGLDENSHANQQLQQQAGQQQQHGAASGVPPAFAADARTALPPFRTPAAARAAAVASPADATPAGRAGAGTSGRPTGRRMADLLSAAPSSRRTVRQQSIASFLLSPATGGQPAGAAAAAAAGPGSSRAGAGAACSPRARAGAAAGSSQRGPMSCTPAAAGAGAGAGGASRSAGKRAAGATSPLLAGMGGSALPSTSPKRLRTTFGQQAPGAGAGAGGACGSRGGSASKHMVAAAAALDPSPEQQCSQAAGRRGGAGGAEGMQRQPSSDENQLGNVAA